MSKKIHSFIRLDHFVFTSRFFKELIAVTTIRQYAGWIWRYFEIYIVTGVDLFYNGCQIYKVTSAFKSIITTY